MNLQNLQLDFGLEYFEDERDSGHGEAGLIFSDAELKEMGEWNAKQMENKDRLSKEKPEQVDQNTLLWLLNNGLIKPVQILGDNTVHGFQVIGDQTIHVIEAAGHAAADVGHAIANIPKEVYDLATNP